jgi:hypothetical protein
VRDAQRLSLNPIDDLFDLLVDIKNARLSLRHEGVSAGAVVA